MDREMVFDALADELPAHERDRARKIFGAITDDDPTMVKLTLPVATYLMQSGMPTDAVDFVHKLGMHCAAEQAKVLTVQDDYAHHPEPEIEWMADVAKRFAASYPLQPSAATA